jgi:nucleotide-binding universal stress UspA family protein
MSSITRIVVATDFSAAAERAVRRAALMTKQLGAELHLLHVVHPLDSYPGAQRARQLRYFGQMLQEASNSRLATLATSLNQDFAIPVIAATRIGRVHAQIADYAKANNVDLIVAGARGENTLLDLNLGSNVSRLLRLAACPMLIVRNSQADSYRQVIAAVDFSGGSAKVPALAHTAAPGARIEVLHIFDQVQEARMCEVGPVAARLDQYCDQAQAEAGAQLDKILAEQGNDHMVGQVLTGYPPAKIFSRSAILHADLIVLGRFGVSGLEEGLLGGVSKDVVHVADCDVLLGC